VLGGASAMLIARLSILLLFFGCGPAASRGSEASTTHATPSLAPRTGDRGAIVRPGTLPWFGESAMSIDGNRLAFMLARRTQQLVVLDIARQEIVLWVEVGARRVISIAWSSDGELLSTLGDDGDLRVVHSRSGALLARIGSGPAAGSTRRSRREHAFSTGDSCIVVVAGGAPGEIWDWFGSKLVASLGDVTDARACAFTLSRSGRYVAIGHDDGIVAVWNVSTGKRIGGPLHVPEGERKLGHLALDFAPDESLLAVGCDDGVVRLFELEGSGEDRRLVDRPPRELARTGPTPGADAVGSVHFDPSGERVFVTLFPWWSIQTWDVASGELIAVDEGSGGNPSPIDTRFSRDGQRVISQTRGVFTYPELRPSWGEYAVPRCLQGQSDGERAWCISNNETLRVLTRG